MYLTHFGLRRRPFRTTPDTESYYPASAHEAALDRLQRALADDEGLALLVGEPGTGKTIVCQRLLEQLGDDWPSAFVTNGHFDDRAGLLQAVLYDLCLPYEGRKEQELRLALTDHLLQNYANGRRTLLVVDEAQHLWPDLLEELRLLGNLETRQGKAVQVVLAAQPAIGETLGHPDLAVFQQRLTARAQLRPLGVQEAADYLIHHLRVAGGRPERIISDEALELLAGGTRGVPRLLNHAAHQALQLACDAEADGVDAEAALEALSRLGLAVEPADGDGYEPAARLVRDADAEAEAPTIADACRSLGALEPEGDDGPPRLFTAPRRPA